MEPLWCLVCLTDKNNPIFISNPRHQDMSKHLDPGDEWRLLLAGSKPTLVIAEESACLIADEKA